MPNPLRLLASLAAVAALATACGSGSDADAAPTSSTTAAPTTTTTAPPASPLTGLPEPDADELGRPALVVKVDNTSEGRARQLGLHLADVVYVEQVEGGATRLAAVFHSTDAEAVGPVRSARTSDVDIVGNLNTPLFAFSGANRGVLREIRGADLVDVGYDAATSVYDERGSGVLRLFVATADMFGLADAAASPPPPLFTFRAPGAAVDAAGAEEVDGVRIGYGGSVSTHIGYEATGDGWRRSQDGAVHEGADGEAVEPANVVVQFTSYQNSGYRDVSGAWSPEAVTVGEGEAWVLTGGRLVRGRWSRPDAGSPTSYTDAAGRPIALAPGRTWVELAPPGAASVVPAPSATSTSGSRS